MDVQTLGRLMTSWCNRDWGPLRLELHRAEAQRWTVAAVWSDGAQAEIEAFLGSGDPPPLLFECTAELSASDLPGVNLGDAKEAFAVRAVIERTVAARPWLLEAESDVRGGITLKLRLSLTTEALDPNVFAASVAELLKVPRAIRWSCLQLAGVPAEALGLAATDTLRLQGKAPPQTRPAAPPPVAPQQPSPKTPESVPVVPTPRPPAAPSPPPTAISEVPPLPPAAPRATPQAAVEGSCGECGQPYRAGAAYCSSCGAKLR